VIDKDGNVWMDGVKNLGYARRFHGPVREAVVVEVETP
jgi:hypothetical protein